VGKEVGRRAELNNQAVERAVAEFLAEAARHVGRDGHGSITLKLFASEGRVTGYQVIAERRTEV
jgi:hypothetical protein